ncbi:MAG TPA: hypothetical protein VM074_12650 [Solimonas sp.]|nr:hypothetical protein [Solimonas sp.]
MNTLSIRPAVNGVANPALPLPGSEPTQGTPTYARVKPEMAPAPKAPEVVHKPKTPEVVHAPQAPEIVRTPRDTATPPASDAIKPTSAAKGDDDKMSQPQKQS